MEPGMLMSVKTRSMSLRFSRIPNRLIGVVSGKNLVARSPKFTACEHVDEDFILDHEYATRHWVPQNSCPEANAAPSQMFHFV